MTKAPFKTIRWQKWDYSSSGTYLVTVCTHDRKMLFGEIINGKMHLSAAGNIVQEEWLRSEAIRTEVLLDEMIVMPNHLHAIVGIRRDIRGVNDQDIWPRNSRDRTPKSLSTFLSSFKAVTTRRIRELYKQSALQVWQGRFHDRVLRNEHELDNARAYIIHNPDNWHRDDENPNRETL